MRVSPVPAFRRLLLPVLASVLGAATPIPACEGGASITPSDSIVIPSAFPRLDYTPFGYIDNPYHSMVFNRSGVIRSVPPLGFGWWRTDFEGAYGEGVRGYVDYDSFLRLSVAVGKDCFAEQRDFARHGTTLVSKYHTGHMMSYDWTDDSVDISLRFFLPRENTLSCSVELVNAGDRPREIRINATNVYTIGGTKWWGSDGLTARSLPGKDVLVSKVWAYGDVFVLGSSLRSASRVCTASAQQWENADCSSDTASVPLASLRGRGPMMAMQSYHVTLPARSSRAALVCLSRGTSEEEALREFVTGRSTSFAALGSQLREDQRFWSRCPVLEGDWPVQWKRGWVYDFETIRMTVRPPLGIFKHPWDGMQIHSPRMVLGETCIDMMTMSYGDDSLAREVLLGTFEDALAPNVPCAREDGSLNMISSDGSECGTAPMWGFPFHVINTIYTSTADSDWVRRLYPHLKAYIDWWLEHRTDAEGWLHCNNSWESGQDGSKRFLVAEGNEGAVADFVRTVDVEASMAEAMRLMGRFAIPAGHPEDRAEWDRLADRRTMNVRRMFVDGWFRDVDGRTNRPIMLKNPYDVMMLAPVACGIASPEQVEAIRSAFPSFEKKMEPWLQWPPGMQTFVEAAWIAGAGGIAAEVVAETADRIYARTDSRTLRAGDEGNPSSYRIPGIANEFWPIGNIRPGGENYGWGASLPTHIIRAIVGFREDTVADGFLLAPSLPDSLGNAGKNLGIRNLHYRGVDLDIMYTSLNHARIRVVVDFRSRAPVNLSAFVAGRGASAETGPALRGMMILEGPKGTVFRVRIDRGKGSSR